ncbi:MAG TPA: hypothetical protein VHI75_00965, partial [Casimicrobiaceae bacterium]|nr:hypothetical protein [Casimicrobiaceae bacterium]
MERADPSPSVGQKLFVSIDLALPNGNRPLARVSTRGMDCAKQQGDGAPAHVCCAKKGGGRPGTFVNHSLRGQLCNEEIFSNDWRFLRRSRPPAWLSAC